MMSMPKTVQIVPSTIYFDTKIRERKGDISGETQEQKRFYLEKSNLTLTEAAEYFNIGEHKLREITNNHKCNFVLFIGTKRLIKRKDNKGRLLRTGESPRKDLTYMYRYTDMKGKRQCVYADDLNKLREKEKKIQIDTLQGLDISGGGITVLELVERYVGLRRNVRYNTTTGYNFVLNILRKEEFGYQ